MDGDPGGASREEIREIARQEAEAAIKDELATETPDGETVTLGDLTEKVGSMAPELSRRDVLKTGVLAFGYVAAGATATTAAVNALSERSIAAPSGTLGTSTAPWDTAYIDTLGTRSTPVTDTNTEELAVLQGRGLLGLPNHHVEYGSGLSNEEVARFTLASGDKLEVWRLEAALKGGGSDASVVLDVYDATAATQLASVTAGSRSEGGSSPLGTSGTGNTILVRVTTGASAVALNASGITAVVT